jgi:predicted nucleic acid-binding protein
MSNFVLDASITLAWCFADEATPATRELLDRLDIDTAYVPQIWPLEIGNILVMAERKKRINYADAMHFLQLLEEINIQIDDNNSLRFFHEIISLAHSSGLTTYDATYLELAMRLGLPLATRDKQLATVAKQLGVKLLI